MAKSVRGLPENFALDLPTTQSDDRPVQIGDFIDEEPMIPMARPASPTRPILQPKVINREMIGEGDASSSVPARLRNRTQGPGIIRYQLNLSPRSKMMLEQLVEHVCTYSPEPDARISEVFQGIVTLLYNALDELDLADLPRRGAWGSVTAKNFPIALSEAFELAVVRAARKRAANH